jgi:hypothetical protein
MADFLGMRTSPMKIKAVYHAEKAKAIAMGLLLLKFHAIL